MKEFDPLKYKTMVKSFQDNDDPTGWFDSIYTDANGDYKNVFWADLKASSHLCSWLGNHKKKNLARAIVIGCGVGDDAQALSESGFTVTAFDISPEAINLCKKRYPSSKVRYLVADLFNYPKDWQESFELVYECNTIQVLPDKYRIQARDAMISLLSLQGHILVSCRSRKENTQESDIPLPLDKYEIDGFIRSGLEEKSFLSYDDNQSPAVAHFFATYQRVK